MKRLLLCCAWLAAAGSAQAAGRWSELWQTADQRGEALLRDGQPAAAAKVFSDPRRRAYAELKAGDYAAAAKGFAAFDDREAHYDRGNALARAGDLQGALKAYDAALKLDPQDEEARHNRDLVAKALEQQKDKPKQDHQQQPDQQQQKKDGKSEPQKQDPSPGQPPQPDPPASATPSHAGSEGKPASAPSEPPPASAAASSAEASASSPKSDDQQRAQATETPASRPDDSAEQAQRDVAPTAAAASAAEDAASTPQRAAAATEPRSERQLAEDQWLRRIPDDPGGLLRRKFMIQHMQRQQSRQLGIDPEASR